MIRKIRVQKRGAPAASTALIQAFKNSEPRGRFVFVSETAKSRGLPQREAVARQVKLAKAEKW